MNVRRFTARTSREALRLLREALGDDAVVLSTRRAGTGVEVLAMPAEGLRQVERLAPPEVAAAAQPAALAASSAEQDAERLEMSTLSFQDYVRTRMLKRRQAALDGDVASATPAEIEAARRLAPAAPASRLDLRVDDENALPGERPGTPAAYYAAEAAAQAEATDSAASGFEPRVAGRTGTPRPMATPPAAAEPILVGATVDAGPARRDQQEMLAELRSMKELIEERFCALAFMEKLQRRPGEALLAQKLLDCGFSPALVRKISEGLGAEVTDEAAWAAQVLEQNLRTLGAGQGIEDAGGVHALIGATGVGKTTTTAKIAAAFAARHGAASLGLITLDAYRVGAHEQLRAYGRILGVPVHTAHDRASLEDLLELLGGKKLVLIDTAGMAQRDARTRELLEMLAHPSIRRVLVVSAASQGETIEDVLLAYRGASCSGVVLSKLDEAVKLGPALDAAIRHRLTIVGVANGQRVPEDWHLLSAHALVQRALRGGGSAAWRCDAADMNLIFAAPRAAAAHAAA